MKKTAKELKQGDQISVFGKVGLIKKVELSDIGKQGKRKVRIEVEVDGEKTVMIRPEDYPISLA
ncbi:hypothetical protein HN832_01935 [archaeon]|jgi:translation elongation factor P/translation initiation factor 5A|nr:hypothetical protein [archaeon]MBT4373113.1 hypothetical protein [archaeon]MBT4531458.1 hypothetical protein [archaeon]MBT7001364.1 hypothetical protein [archaeon]MBT7282150.1 hypothetical protein [archaeon]